MRDPWRKSRTRPDTKWYARAACAEANPDIFFDDELIEQAKAICSLCPVQQQCLTTALENEEAHGVWGGQSTQERQMRRAG